MKELRRQWKKQPWEVAPPSRKTVEDMLVANDCRKPTPKKSRRGHTEKVTRYFPGAQVLLDGKEVVLSLLGRAHKFVVEFCQDSASSAIGGSAIGKTETAELVKEAVADFTTHHGKPLATLQDNGSGNNKAAIDFGAGGMLVIKAHPYRPETKGLIEGEFGLFEKKVSAIEIAGETEKEIAQSILKQIVAVYVRLRNQIPRCSVCPFTPQEMMNYQPDAAQKQQAYDQLKAAGERKAQQQEQRMKVSQAFHDLTDQIIKEHRLTGDPRRFKQSLTHVELSVIRNAELQFTVQSSRDNFDEAKRTLAYFSAIARALQAEKDAGRRQVITRRRYALDQEASRKRAEIEACRAEQRKRVEYKKHPEKAMVKILQAEMNLPPNFRARSTLFKGYLKTELQNLIKGNHPAKVRQCLINTEKSIMELGQYSINVRQEMIKMVHDYLKI